MYRRAFQIAWILLLSTPITAWAVCGDAILDTGESCDDGNMAGGDGCSASCLVEPGWSCTLPSGGNPTNLIADPGFEAGPGGGIWTESSVAFGTPICNSSMCGDSFQRSGDYWAWFGGVIIDEEEAMVSQTITVPDTAYELSFWLRVDLCDSPSDYIEVLFDSTQIWEFRGDNPSCGDALYSEVVLDITAYADNAEHELAIHAETISVNEDSSDFHVDDLYLPSGPADPVPSVCELISVEEVIFRDGFEQ